MHLASSKIVIILMAREAVYVFRRDRIFPFHRLIFGVLYCCSRGLLLD